MKTTKNECPIHPEGEDQNVTKMTSSSWPLDTPGGRYYAEWDDSTPVTREGQLVFFFQFLKTGGLWEDFLCNCPLRYTGNRGSGALNVMGTALLSILCGHWRYAHINAVRGDRVNPGLLGMDKTVSEDVVRLAMSRMDEAESLDWLSDHLVYSIEPILDLPWTLDIDVTVKPLFGKQEGAQVGYNPHKPGRPSHVYHSYFVAGLRICMGVEVRPGNEHAAAKGLPELWKMLSKLPRHKWPVFVRGDCGYGSETVMVEFEANGLPYLFKLRFTKKVKELVQRMMKSGSRWEDCGDGWEALESRLRLSGWSQERRVILVREKPARAPASTSAGRKRGKDRQLRLPQATGPGWDAEATPWCGKIAVLVTSLDENAYPAASMPHQYRQRADEENCFDELKNQWGWSGFTSRKLKPCRIMANLIALFYNWWTLYLRFYDAEHHREAIRSRPMLMAGIGRQVESGRKRTVRVSILYDSGQKIAAAVTRISNQLHHIATITERWTNRQRWILLLNLLFRSWLGGKRLNGLSPGAEIFLSG